MAGSDYGLQLPVDASSDPTGVAFIVRRMIERLDTMKLCQVTSVTGGGVAAPGTVNVQLLVNQIDGATPPNGSPRGIVTNVPWSRVAGGKNAIICDPIVNDIGYLVCADRDISVVKKTNAQGNPGSQRRYSVSDSVYCPMGYNVTPNQYLIFTSTGIRIVDLNNNSVAFGSSGITISVAGNTIGQFTSTGLAITGNISATGTIFSGFGGADQVGLQTHIHAANGDPPTPGT